MQCSLHSMTSGTSELCTGMCVCGNSHGQHTLKVDLVYRLRNDRRKRKRCRYGERETGGDKRKYYSLAGF